MELSDLYDRHAARLFAVALRITSDRTAAARALEETFASIRGYDAQFGSPEAWLLRTVRNRALAQDRSHPAAVENKVGGPPTARQLIEEAFYRGRTAPELASAYAIDEREVRRMLHDGIADLRRQVAVDRNV